MQIKEIATKSVITAQPFETVSTVARQMRDRHVGDIVIVEKDSEGDIPVGIITDRDIVLHVIAEELPCDTTLVGDVMTDDLVRAHESDEISEVIDLMNRNGVRRIPVVNRYGFLTGIITMDDLLPLAGGKKLRALPHQQVNWEKAMRGLG